MKPLLKSLLVTGAVALVLAVAPPVYAICSAPTPAGQYLDAYFRGMPEAYLCGRVFVFQKPYINNGLAEFFCRGEGDPSANTSCFATAGTEMDNFVTIQGDWFASGVNGCPATSNQGDDPNVALLMSILNEGTASHEGVYILTSVGYDALTNKGFFFDYAQYDGMTMTIKPQPAIKIPSPRITPEGFTNNGNGTATANLNWNTAITIDDCSQNVLGTCVDYPNGTRPVLHDRSVLSPAVDEPSLRLGHADRDRFGLREYHDRHAAVRPERHQLYFPGAGSRGRRPAWVYRLWTDQSLLGGQ